MTPTRPPARDRPPPARAAVRRDGGRAGRLLPDAAAAGDRLLPRVAARPHANVRGVDRHRPADAVGVHPGVRHDAARDRPAVGPDRPPAGDPRRPGAVPAGERRLRAGAVDRAPDRGACVCRRSAAAPRSSWPGRSSPTSSTAPRREGDGAGVDAAGDRPACSARSSAAGSRSATAFARRSPSSRSSRRSCWSPPRAELTETQRRARPAGDAAALRCVRTYARVLRSRTSSPTAGRRRVLRRAVRVHLRLVVRADPRGRRRDRELRLLLLVRRARATSAARSPAAACSPRAAWSRTLKFSSAVSAAAGLAMAGLAAAGVVHWAAIVLPQFVYMFAHGMNLPCPPGRGGDGVPAAGRRRRPGPRLPDDGGGGGPSGWWIGASNDGTVIPLTFTIAAAALAGARRRPRARVARLPAASTPKLSGSAPWGQHIVLRPRRRHRSISRRRTLPDGRASGRVS